MATTYANYESFGNYANEISNLSGEAYKKVKLSYELIRSLNSPTGWRGVNYDNLVDSFNSMVESFNTIFNEIQYIIPSSIRTIAGLYASFDTSSVSKATDQADKISSIDKSNTTALTFEIGFVTNTKESVKARLSEAKENVQSIRDCIEKMNTDWQGDEYEDVSLKIHRYVGQLASNMDQLINDIDNFFNKTNDEYNQTKSKVTSTLDIA